LRRQKRKIAEKGQRMLEELFENQPIDNVTYTKILNYYGLEKKEEPSLFNRR